jgi:hypothetical protein
MTFYFGKNGSIPFRETTVVASFKKYNKKLRNFLTQSEKEKNIYSRNSRTYGSVFKQLLTKDFLTEKIRPEIPTSLPR